MKSAQRLSLSTLLFCAAGPLVWLACGGSKPPPETPADESTSSSDSAKPSGDDTSAPASSSTTAAADTSSPPPADTTPPPAAAPPISGTDCGKCIDKTCAKPAAACGKNTDCQSTMDAFHSCGSDKGAAACVDSATPPTGAKPKKLATAYETCAKKAIAKACKAKCQ